MTETMGRAHASGTPVDLLWESQGPVPCTLCSLSVGFGSWREARELCRELRTAHPLAGPQAPHLPKKGRLEQIHGLQTVQRNHVLLLQATRANTHL